MWQTLKNLYHLLLAACASLFYRYPAKNLKVIGVTGTDGKTTTAHLIYHLLKSAGKKVFLISSVKAVISGKEYETGFHVTTPDPWEVQKYLRRAMDGGAEYVVLEVTSHALDQNRVVFCHFLVGVLTNITHEHLDYHRTWENYVAAKIKLFKMAKIAVINRDDASYQCIESLIQKDKVVTYGIKKRADFTPQSFPFKTKLLGEFNRYNALAAIACIKSLGVEEDLIRKALLSFAPPVGRLETVVEKPFRVMVDFAHTPNALEKALKTVRSLTKGKIVVVFGCAGLRDFQKRPLMGEISTQYADISILTAEDPRTEDVNEIIEQISQGCLRGGAKEITVNHFEDLFPYRGKPYFFRIPDRQEAINFAIQKLAKRGDLVIICGKGHERSMCFGKKEFPWSDHEVVKKAFP